MLFDAAAKAGVGRIVHFSVANASSECRLPYFRGKGQVEEILQDLGIPFAIIRPTLVFGEGDLLLNNMAWARRRFPVFPVFENGDYKIQPIYAEDLAAQAVASGSLSENTVADAAGPDTFTFDELLRLLASGVNARGRLGAYTGVAGVRPDPPGRPAAARRGADQGRGCRTDGGVADFPRSAGRDHQVGRLARR